MLSRVERPARYLNHEWGCAAPVAEGDFAFCMIYPDTYELGQANQAVRILVNAVNAMGGMNRDKEGQSMEQQSRNLKNLELFLEKEININPFPGIDKE